MLRAIEQLGYVQIDTISVVERAHHHVLRSRVPNYRPAFLDQLQREGKVFEYWYHAAAYLPMRDYRFAKRDMQAAKRGEQDWVRSRDYKLMQRILDRVRLEGPLKSRDFEDNRTSKEGWWDWKPAKRALEQLFIDGDLMVTKRDGFQKTYDLPERALPPNVSTEAATLDEFAAYLVRNCLRSHGFATRKSFTHLRSGAGIREAVTTVLEEGVAVGKLCQFNTKGGDTYWGDAELLDRRRRRPRPKCASFPLRQRRHPAPPGEGCVRLRLSGGVLRQGGKSSLRLLLPADPLSGPAGGPHGLQGPSRQRRIQHQAVAH